MSSADQPGNAGPQVTTSPAAGAAPETGIQASNERIPLPPAAAPAVTPEALIRRVAGLDVVLVGVLLVFAFVTASFKASNSDLLMHLATGRLIVQGAFGFGSDPYTFGAEGAWVEHAWLFDVIAYLTHRLPGVGPELLIVGKALLVTGLAWLMYRSGSMPGRRGWIPAACALLGVLALSPRLLMQPMVVSFFLLGVTLYLLQTTPAGSRRLWALPVVCLVWVNMDQWFLLGPVTILLWLLGEVIDPLLAPAAEGQARPPVVTDQVRGLGLVLLASVAACVVNPYHVRALQLPWLLTASGTALGQEPLYRGFFLSPFGDYKAYLQDNIGLSVAGMSYLVLLVAGVASFGLLAVYAADRLRAGRALVWLAMALLGAYNLRLIPFFAVVGAPLMALNYLDLSERLFGAAPRPERNWQQWAVAGRVLTILAGLALIVGSVGGYVQARPYHLRQVGWGVSVDEGLKGAALQVDEWRKQGALEPGQRWFNLAPEVVNYLAWYSPGEKGYVDQRIGLFAGAGADLKAVRGSLESAEQPREVLEGRAEPAWRPALRERQARFVVVHLTDPGRQEAMLRRLYGTPDEWVPCYVGGKTAIFAWRDPKAVVPGASPAPVDPRVARDFAVEAFGPGVEPLPDGLGGPAPKQPWWRPILGPGKPPSAEGWEALQHYSRFDAMSGRYGLRHQTEWVARVAASLVGLAGQPAGPVQPATMLIARLNVSHGQMAGPRREKPDVFDDMALSLLFSYVRQQDSGPPDALYLTIREARKGLAECGDDARTYLVLAQAYSRLLNRTRERSRTASYVMSEREGPRPQPFFVHVDLIRRAQVAAALNEVFKLDPSARLKQVAHLHLLEVYQERQYLELQVKHFREYVQLCKALKYVPTVPQERALEEVDRLSGLLKELETELKNAQNKYEVQAAGKTSVLDKAGIAMRNGLPETALKLLTEASPKDLAAPGSRGESVGAYLALELLLAVGRIDEARDALVEAAKEPDFDRRVFGTHPLGLPAYEWFRVMLGAATGDYQSADQFLEECIKKAQVVPDTSRLLQGMEVILAPLGGKDQDLKLSDFAAITVGDILLREAPAAALGWQWGRFVPLRRRPPQEPPVRFVDLTLRQAGTILGGQLRQQADLWTLRAWLALEQGRTAKASEFARVALRLGGRGKVGDQFLFEVYPSRPLAELVLDLTERQGKKR